MDCRAEWLKWRRLEQGCAICCPFKVKLLRNPNFGGMNRRFQAKNSWIVQICSKQIQDGGCRHLEKSLYIRIWSVSRLLMWSIVCLSEAHLPSVRWRCWLAAGRTSGLLKTEWWDFILQPVVINLCWSDAVYVVFYSVMHYSAKRGLAIACRLVRLSVTLVDHDHIG